MCVLFVDIFAGRVLLHVSGPDQTRCEVMEHAGVTLRLTDGEPLKNGSVKWLASGTSDFAYSPSLVY